MVFGQPLSTQRKKRELAPFTTYNLASKTFSDSNVPDTSLPGEYSSKLGDPNNIVTYLKTAFANPDASSECFKSEGQSTFVPAETSPKNNPTDTDKKSDIASAFRSNPVTGPIDTISISARTDLSSAIAPDASRFLFGETPNTNSLLSWGSPVEQPLAKKTPGIPFDFSPKVRKLQQGLLRYGLYQFSDDNSKLMPETECEAMTESWGDFMDAFDNCKSGFELHRKDDQTVLSIKNLRHECASLDEYGKLQRDLFKEPLCRHEKYLYMHKLAWIERLKTVFENVQSVDETRIQEILLSTCDKYLHGYVDCSYM